MAGAEQEQEVAVLLSTYNGARYLGAQLDSLLAQTHPAWTLYWRDDGSSDATPELMREFGLGAGAGRCVDVSDGEPLRVTRSFLRLLAKARAGRARYFAFADQDDVWLEEKLAGGVAVLAAVPDGVPALYCARQMLVDAELHPLKVSAPLRRKPGFATALTQNIAAGCTMMLNRAAAELVLASRPPEETLHDWWCYLVVAGGGGQVMVDQTPTILYRQHAANVVGAPRGRLRRAIAALRRGPAQYMRVLRAHVAALRAQPHLLSASARHELEIIARALEGGIGARVAALRLPGFARQTVAESAIFWLWFLLG